MYQHLNDACIIIGQFHSEFQLILVTLIVTINRSLNSVQISYVCLNLQWTAKTQWKLAMKNKLGKWSAVWAKKKNNFWPAKTLFACWEGKAGKSSKKLLIINSFFCGWCGWHIHLSRTKLFIINDNLIEQKKCVKLC